MITARTPFRHVEGSWLIPILPHAGSTPKRPASAATSNAAAMFVNPCELCRRRRGRLGMQQRVESCRFNYDCIDLLFDYDKQAVWICSALTLRRQDCDIVGRVLYRRQYRPKCRLG